METDGDRRYANFFFSSAAVFHAISAWSRIPYFCRQQVTSTFIGENAGDKKTVG